MSYLGDFALGSTFDFKFTTVATTGAPTTLAGTPVISIYPDNSTIELTAGITLSVDFDSRTGMHNVRVVASSGNGYASGVNYAVVITTGTVGGASVVGYVVGHFSIEARSALRPVTAGRTLVVDAAGLADANAVKVGPSGSGTAQTARDVGASVLISSGSGAGQLDVTSGVIKSNLAQILGTALTETAGQLAGGFKKFFNIATPAATMDHLVLVDTVTTATTATNLTNAPTSGDLTATMKASVTTAATAATPIAASVTGAVGSVTGGVTVSTNNDKTGYALTAGERTAIANEVESQIIDETDSEKVLTAITNKIAAVNPSLAGLTIAAIASGVRTELTTELGHLDADVSSRLATSGYTAPLSAASTRTAVGLASANLDTQFSGVNTKLDAIDDYVDTEVAAIKAKTDNLPSDPADASDIAAAFAALNDPSAAEIADAVWEETLADHSGTTGSTAEALGAAGSAGDPWATALPGSYGAGSAGKIIGDRVDVTISSRAATGAAMTLVDDAITSAKIATDAIGANELAAGAVSKIQAAVAAGAVASVTGNVGGNVVGTIGGLSAQAKADVNAEADTALADYDAPTHAELTAELATADDATLAAIAGLNNLSQANVRTAVGLGSANLDTQLSGINSKTTNLPSDPADESLIIAATDAIMTRIGAAGAGLTALGDTRLAHLDADVSSRLASGGYTAPLDAAAVRSAVGLASANLDTQLDALPTNAELATALAGADDATLAAVAAVKSDTAAILVDTGTSGVKVDDSTPLDANVKQVNDVDLTGDGDAEPWGPA